MEEESLSSASLMEKQLKNNQHEIKKIASILQKKSFRFIQTVARGSSAHAAHFGKYLFETKYKLATASASLVTYTLYKSSLDYRNSLVIAISQSGQSPDICEYMQNAKKKGALTVALVNETHSPLAQGADFLIALGAKRENAVAATKSFLLTLSALIQLISYLVNDNELLSCLGKLSEKLCIVDSIHKDFFIDFFKHIHKLFVVSRGYSYPIACEAALKYMETCNIQAHAFSSAELMHGPISLVDKEYPVVLFMTKDAAENAMKDTYDTMLRLQAKPFLFIPQNLEPLYKPKENYILLPNSLHPICDPLIAIHAFYPLVAKLALARGKNPDLPPNLQKVTKTT